MNVFFCAPIGGAYRVVYPSFALRIFACVLVILSFKMSSTAQSTDSKFFQYTPAGERTIIVSGASDPLKALRFSATNKTIRFSTGTQSHVYNAPVLLDIVDARFKLDSFGVRVDVILVLLSNGSIVRLDYTGTPKQKRLDPSPNGSETYKILGDDLYIMGFDRVYVSKEGFNWAIDTTGLGGFATLKDIDIDRSQKVWLATIDGLFTQELESTVWIKNQNYPASPFAPPAADKVFIDRLQNVWVSYFNTLQVSTNGGVSFQNAPKGLSNNKIIDITDDAFGNIYAMSENNLYYSNKGTEPFVRIDLPVMADFAAYTTKELYKDASGDSLLYLGTVAGMYVSSNQGATWSYDGTVRAEHIGSVAATVDNRLLMTTNTGMFRLDGPDSWTKRYPQVGFVPGSMVFTSKNGDVYVVAERKGINSEGFAVNVVYRSVDNGNSFLPDTAGLGAADVGMSIFFIDENGVQHASARTKDGFLKVWKKQPGSSWELDGDGISASLDFNNTPTVFGTDNNGSVYLAIFNSNSLNTEVHSRPITGGSWSIATTVNGNVYDIKGRNGIVTMGSSAGVRYNTGSGWKIIPRPAGVSSSVDWCHSEVDNNGNVWGYYETYDVNLNQSRGEGIYFTKDKSTWQFAGADTLVFGALVAIGDSVFGLTSGHNGTYVFYPKAVTSSIKNDELGNEFQVSVYPNPSNYVFSIDLSGTSFNPAETTITLFNIQGKKIFERFPTTVQNQFSVEGLHKGTYVLHIDNQKTKVVKKLLVD